MTGRDLRESRTLDVRVIHTLIVWPPPALWSRGRVTLWLQR